MSTSLPAAVAAPTLASVAAPPVEACRNCETPRVGAYCHGCSQPFQLGELTLRRLVLDFLVRHLSLEGGLLRTFKELCTRPGAMVRDYLDGRRQRYTHPVGYLALAAAASGLASGVWREETARALSHDLLTGGTPDEQALQKAIVQGLVYLEAHPLATTLLLCLFVVPLLRLFFRTQIRTAEASVFAFYIMGHALLLEAMLKPFAFAFFSDPVDDLNSWTTAILLLLCGAGAGGLFGVRFSTFLRMGAVLALSMTALLCSVLAALVVLLLAARI